MTTQVTKSVIVNVPVSRAYNQWTQFEDFPQFMGGVQKVTQLGDDRLEGARVGHHVRGDVAVVELRQHHFLDQLVTELSAAPVGKDNLTVIGEGKRARPQQRADILARCIGGDVR